MRTLCNSIDKNFREIVNNFETCLNQHRLSSDKRILILRGLLGKNPRMLIGSFKVEPNLSEEAKDLLRQEFFIDVKNA